jgi:acyl-CoA thioester hydrolase
MVPLPRSDRIGGGKCRKDRPLTALTPLTEWTVPREEIDHIDHMGTAFYAWRAERDVLRFIEDLCGPAPGLKLAVLDRHTHYRREQRLGAPLRMTAGVTSASHARLGVYMEIANTVTGELAAMFNLEVEARHRADGASAPIPDPIRAAAAARLIEPAARSRPRSLTPDKTASHLTPADFQRAGIVPHIRQEIPAEACDAEGFLIPARPVFRPDTHIPRVGVMADVWTGSPGHFWPMIEQRDVKPRTPRAGDVLETYEALIKVEHKAMHSANWVFEARGGALVEASHMVTVFFSAETRRAVGIPPDLRARLDSLARPGFLTRP